MKIVTTPMCEEIVRLAGFSNLDVNCYHSYFQGFQQKKVPKNFPNIQKNFPGTFLW